MVKRRRRCQDSGLSVRSVKALLANSVVALVVAADVVLALAASSNNALSLGAALKLVLKIIGKSVQLKT